MTQKINKIREIETKYKLSITCPYCGYEDRDSWESDGVSGDGAFLTECKKCEKEFKYESDHSVTYSSWKIEDENKPLHDKQKEVDDLASKLK